MTPASILSSEGLRLIPSAADSSYQQLRRHHPARQKSDYTVPLYGSSVDNGAPHESDVTKFVNKIGADLDVYFVQLLRFIHKNVQIEGIKAFHIFGFLQHSNRFGVRIKTRTGTKFTSYSRGKKRASTHWAGMTLIRDALFGLGIINITAKRD